jgi:hypothetical protein
VRHGLLGYLEHPERGQGEHEAQSYRSCANGVQELGKWTLPTSVYELSCSWDHAPLAPSKRTTRQAVMKPDALIGLSPFLSAGSTYLDISG